MSKMHGLRRDFPICSVFETGFTYVRLSGQVEDEACLAVFLRDSYNM